MISSLLESVFFGLVVYLILQSLLVPFRIIFPLSIVISLLIFGLTNYYGSDVDEDKQPKQLLSDTRDRIQEKSGRPSISHVFFVSMYVIIIIITVHPYQNQEIFIHWNQFTVFQLERLVAAVVLTFFAPGYAIVGILDRKHELGRLPKFLISYLLSILVTGLVGYTMASIGSAVSNVNILLGSINALILLCFLYIKILDKEFLSSSYTLHESYYNMRESIRKNAAKIIVFTSLFAIEILSTYYQYNGTIIADEWFHHGQALEFLHGTWKDLVVHGWIGGYPFFHQAFLAAYFALSNVPSVNAYVAINFANIIPVFAFYYFFSKWLPGRRKAAVLASTLFMLSSGFGWLYLLGLETTMNNSTLSTVPVLELFLNAGIKTFDIFTPGTFIDVAHPDITTGLIITALPAGFVLLGLMKEDMKSRMSYITIVAAISFLGFLSHDEFGLFVIIASITQLIFRLSSGTSLFTGMLIALSFVSIIAILSPDNYYRTKSILGVNFIVLFLIFVIATWLLYSNKALYKLRYQKTRITFNKILDKTANIVKRDRFILGITICSIVSYLYILSFIIWDFQNPIFDARFNTNGLTVVPWYLYPLRFGITGILGISLILSYIFKKFEKEIFIFGIIAIVAFFAGPYYDEHRFSKYILVSMAGFASLFLYKIVSTIRQQPNPKKILIGLIIGSIVISCSLSIIMYVGYSALALINQDLRSRILLAEIWFPSDSEMRLFGFFQKNVNPLTDSIAVPPKELLFHSGLLGEKLQGFIGIPLGKIAESSLSLKESTLGGFYSRLDHTNTKFIVLYKQDTKNNKLSNVLNFASENFKRAYEDENYIVLLVPSLAPPSLKGGNVALVSRDYGLGSYGISVLSKKALEILPTLNNANLKLWANNKFREQNVNYIEGSFRIINLTKPDSQVGIVWTDRNSNKDNYYYAFVRPQTSQLSIYTPGRGEFIHVTINPPIAYNSYNCGLFPGKCPSYTLKVVYSDNAIDVFLNDVLEVQIPQVSSNTSILNVGTETFNSVAEYEPLKIGTASISKIGTSNHSPNYNYNYYYSLSSLALSTINYNIFAEGDESAFSKKSVVLPFDPPDTDSYLKFVKRGGTVIVLSADRFKDLLCVKPGPDIAFEGLCVDNTMNTNVNSGGGFRDLLCVKPGPDIAFDGLTGSGGQHINISGKARGIELSCLGPTVKSFYINSKTKQITPFVVQKDYGNGKILFVNVFGYFSAVSTYPDQFFLTLKNISNLISPNADKYTKTVVLDALPSPRFFGNLETSGEHQQPVLVNSSSLLFPTNYELNAKSISTKQYTFNHPKIRDLTLYGNYNVLINSTLLSYIPTSSPYGYARLLISSGSNMTVKLFPGSRVEFFNEIDNRNIEVSDGDIKIIKINGGVGSYTIPILIKTPEIHTDGKTSFQQLYSTNPINPSKAWVVNLPLQVQGKATLRLDHVTNDADNVTRYITYFRWIDISKFNPHPMSAQTGQLLKIPWRDVISSSDNIKLIMTIVIIDVIILYVQSVQKSKKRNRSKEKR